MLYLSNFFSFVSMGRLLFFTAFPADELFCFVCVVIEASQRAKKSLTRPASETDVRNTRRNRAPLVPLSPTTLEARHHKTDASSVLHKDALVQATSNSNSSRCEPPAPSSGCQATGMTDSKTDSTAADGLTEAGASAVEMSSGVSPQESAFPQQRPMHQSPSNGHLYQCGVGGLRLRSGGGSAESLALCGGSPVCHQKRQRSHHRSKQCASSHNSSNTAQSGAVPSASLVGAAPDWQR